MLRCSGCLSLRRGGLRASLAAISAQVLLIVSVFRQAVVERVTHLQAIEADVVDALDGLVDSLAIKDPAAQLLDSDPEEIGVLAFDLAPSSFVLGKIRIFLGLVGQIVEAAVLVLL